MDIAKMSIYMSQGYVQQQASIALMKNTLDMAQQQGQAMQELIQSADLTGLQHAAQPHLGGNIDIKL